MYRLVLICVLAALSADAFVRRDVSTQPEQNNIVESFQKNIDMFRVCVDQSMARAVDSVSERTLQPLFSVIGDQLNRVTKAFEDLTAPIKKSKRK